MSKRTDTELIFKGLSIFKFNYSKFYYCRIYVGGRKHIVKSTGEVSKINARKVSEEMYLDLKQQNRVGVSEQKTFRYFSKLLIQQEKRLSGTVRNKRFGNDSRKIIERKDLGLDSFFGHRDIGTITTLDIKTYLSELDSRREQPLTYSTKSKYLVTLRKVLNLAYENGHTDRIPLIPKVLSNKKDNPRQSFSEDEYKLFLKTLKEEIEKQTTVRGIKLTMEHYYFVLFAVHTFMRPTYSELFGIKHKDISIIKKEPKRLEIKVKGKTGFRIVSSLSYAVEFYEKLLKMRPQFKQDDYVFFPEYKNRDTSVRNFNRQFNYVLKICGLKFTSYNQPRTSYALRHFSLQTRLRKSNGKVNIFYLAKNAGTSVNQLERFYLKNMELNSEVVENLQSF